MLGSKKPKKPEGKKNETHNETSSHNGTNETHLPHNETNETHSVNDTSKQSGKKHHRVLENSEVKSNKTNFGREQKPPQPPRNVTF
jgi:hypothetical protein